MKSIRFFPMEIRETTAGADGDSAGTVEGYAAVFDMKSLPLFGLFREVIKPGAFTRTLADDEQLALWNHMDGEPLGRTGNRTLTLEEDAHGLAFRLQLPDTTRGRDAYALIKRGDVRSMSFGFQVREEDQADDDEGLPLREVRDVKLFEVSPVTFPAYPATEVEARAIAEHMGIDEERVRDALPGVCSLAARELQAPLSGDDGKAVVGTSADHDEVRRRRKQVDRERRLRTVLVGGLASD